MSTDPYTLRQEIANSVTHGIGTALSVAGLTLLVVFASLHGSARHVVSVAVYGTTLVLLYLASTLYHAIQHEGAKRILKILDHVAIFLLIAGTYTPFTLISLRGPWGWSLFGTVWGLATIGIVFKLFFTGKYKRLSTIVYLLMGWIIAVALRPLAMALPTRGLILLFLGGLAYSVGVIFYVQKERAYSHAVWHLFVILGSLCHFFSVLFYVLPRPPAG